VSVTRFASSVFRYSKENVVQGRAERQAKSLADMKVFDNVWHVNKEALLAET
jgi:hypothetical protein